MPGRFTSAMTTKEGVDLSGYHPRKPLKKLCGYRPQKRLL